MKANEIILALERAKSALDVIPSAGTPEAVNEFVEEAYTAIESAIEEAEEGGGNDD